MTPGPEPMRDGIECLRCGFRVNLEGASVKGRARLTRMASDHISECPTRPTSFQMAEARKAARERRWEELRARRAVETPEDRRTRRLARRLRAVRA